MTARIGWRRFRWFLGLALCGAWKTAVWADGRATPPAPSVEQIGALVRELERRADQLQAALERCEAQRRQEDLIRAGRAMREQWPETETPDLAWSLNDAGLAMAAEGRRPEARLLFERALILLERTVEPTHAARGTVLQNLGETLTALGDPATGAARLRDAVMVFGVSAGSGHPRLAAALNAWATAVAAQGRADEAETLYRRAMRIYESGADRTADAAAPMHNLGVLMLSQGRAEEAGVLLDRAMEALKRARQEESPSALAVLRALVRQRRAIGKADEASRFEEQAGALSIKTMERAAAGAP